MVRTRQISENRVPAEASTAPLFHVHCHRPTDPIAAEVVRTALAVERSGQTRTNISENRRKGVTTVAILGVSNSDEAFEGP
jgi:hypothetical protein